MANTDWDYYGLSDEQKAALTSRLNQPPSTILACFNPMIPGWVCNLYHRADEQRARAKAAGFTDAEWDYKIKSIHALTRTKRYCANTVLQRILDNKIRNS